MTAMPGDLEGLIRRLETATEGSRELDGDVSLAVTTIDPFLPDQATARKIVRATAPLWTTSIDYAVKLIPQGSASSI